MPPGTHKKKEQAAQLDVFEEFVPYLGSMTMFRSVVNIS